MENPFQILDERLERLERMMAKVLSLIESQQDQQPHRPELHSRKSPATRKLAAEYLGVSVPTVDLLVKSKQLRPTRIGRAVRFTWDELDAFISKRSK